MNFWEYLHHVGERRNKRPPDTKLLIGTLFIIGYYAVVFRISQHDIPAPNLDLIKDAMLQLGPPVGVIVGALFRSDRSDEQKSLNTQEAFKAIQRIALTDKKPDVVLEPGETAQAKEPEQ